MIRKLMTSESSISSIQKDWLKNSRILIPNVGPRWNEPSKWNELEYELEEYYISLELGSRERPQINLNLDRSVLILIYEKAVKFAAISEIEGLYLSSRDADHGSGDRLKVKYGPWGNWADIAYHPNAKGLYELAQELSRNLNMELHCRSSGYVRHYDDHYDL